MQPSVLATELRHLSEAWRKKATGIELRHASTDPHTTTHVVAAFETCAEEIEELVRQAEFDHKHGDFPV